MSQTIKILCSGDLHLGRRASRVPPALDTQADQFSATRAWRDMVRLAVELRVDLVALSGDIVDRANRYFESFGPLEQGVATLAEAGIPVVAVAGNHDFDVLPRLAAGFPQDQFRLLGSDGTWERFTLSRDGEPVLYIDGWSFPGRYYPQDPLATYRPAPADNIPLIGLLHADLDQPASRYAPVRSGDLLGRGVTFWLLGHIHIPMLYEDGTQPRLLYPGTPMPFNPSETGPHGPWLLQIGSRRVMSVEQLPLSPLRYENLPVSLEGATTLEEAEARIASALRDFLAETVFGHGEALRLLVTRLELTGRTSLHRAIEGHLHRIIADLAPCVGQATAVIDTFTVDTRPKWDLEHLVHLPGPPGELARMLLRLKDPQDSLRQEILLDARKRLDDLKHSRFFRDLDHDQESDDALVTELERQGLLLLDELLSQKEDGA